ncbi:hypothetical protein BBD40_18385 [Paenibacillus ihbetae]|uniref:Uncharacterized protein n=1 Tax=Paenibacillus ihbetae TaxID=1870820 RepID=A0ABX3K2H1_9BACL|nr:hypothetical protein BBD40_18385 [Paenibacillus ihbetae]
MGVAVEGAVKGRLGRQSKRQNSCGAVAISVRKNGQTTNNSPVRNFMGPPLGKFKNYAIMRLKSKKVKVNGQGSLILIMFKI